MITPTIGRIVIFKFDNWRAEEVNRRRKDYTEKAAWHSAIRSGAQVHVGNTVSDGGEYPAIIVAVWGNTPTAAVNLKVLLDGSDDYWVTSVSVGDTRDQKGRYHWMEYQKGQAAKTEALETKLSAA